MLETPNKNQDYSKTERMSIQEQDKKDNGNTDEVVSDNNVSEQIKSIEGRQMLICNVLDSRIESIANTGREQQNIWITYLISKQMWMGPEVSL